MVGKASEKNNFEDLRRFCEQVWQLSETLFQKIELEFIYRAIINLKCNF